MPQLAMLPLPRLPEIWDALGHLMDGRLEDLLAATQRYQVRSKEAGLEEYARVGLIAMGIRPRIYMGNADDYLESRLPSGGSLRPFFFAHLGRDREVTEQLNGMLARRLGITSIEDETSVYWDIPALEAAVLVGHRETADLMLRRFSTNTLATTGIFYFTVIARHLGAAAVLLGRLEEARAHYQEVLEVATEMKCRPEIALTRLQLAELLLEHYPKRNPKRWSTWTSL